MKTIANPVLGRNMTEVDRHILCDLKRSCCAGLVIPFVLVDESSMMIVSMETSTTDPAQVMQHQVGNHLLRCDT